MLVRQVLGAISKFEKTSLVAKLKSARSEEGCYRQVRRSQELCRAQPRNGCSGLEAVRSTFLSVTCRMETPDLVGNLF